MRLSTPLITALGLALSMAAQSHAADPVYPPIELNIAHINDHHSNLQPIPDFEIQVRGIPTRMELGGMARIAALFKESEAKPNLLKLHAGDATTGTLFHTLFKGQADAAVMNTICFDAFSLGNHEFDDTDTGLKRFLDFLRQGDCHTPVVTANVQPQTGTPLAPEKTDDYLMPYLIRHVNGVPVGIFGLVVRGKTVESSRPLPTTRFFDETETAQKTIDLLKAKGVRHIVLLTHHGYDADLILAPKLTDVDVIIGGDSHTMLGDFSQFGITAAGPYPTVLKNKDGDPVCIGQSWEYSKVFGLMNVKFDEKGTISGCSGQASLALGDDFSQMNEKGQFAPVDETRRQAILADLTASPAVRVVAPAANTAAEIARYAGLMSDLTKRVIGQADESLCLVRVPGEATNRSGGIAGCEEANKHGRGSDAAQVVAEAFLQASKKADFALQNAGGVRTPLPAGPITFETANKVLPFSNVLVELPVTGAQMLATLEDGVATHMDNPGSPGSHPYAAGLRWNLDLSKPRGQRFSEVEVKDKKTGVWSPLDTAKTYILVTNDFVGSGKEGYNTLGAIYASGNYVNTYLLYTQTFVDYVQTKGHIARPSLEEYSHKQVISKDGNLLPR